MENAYRNNRRKKQDDNQGNGNQQRAEDVREWQRDNGEKRTRWMVGVQQREKGEGGWWKWQGRKGRTNTKE